MGEALTKEEALKAFEERKKKASAPGYRVKNWELPAGSPIYFYCKGCGIHHATVSESYIYPPHPFCDACQAMKDAGLVVG